MQSVLVHCGPNCLGEVKKNKNLREDNPSKSLDLNLGPSDTKQESSPTLFTRCSYYSRAKLKDENHFAVKYEVLFILNNNFGLLIFLQSFPLRFLIFIIARCVIHIRRRHSDVRRIILLDFSKA
jgi:hypothetical protein